MRRLTPSSLPSPPFFFLHAFFFFSVFSHCLYFFLCMSCGVSRPPELEEGFEKLLIIKCFCVTAWGSLKEPVPYHVVQWWVEIDGGFHNLGAFCLDEPDISLLPIRIDYFRLDHMSCVKSLDCTTKNPNCVLLTTKCWACHLTQTFTFCQDVVVPIKELF